MNTNRPKIAKTPPSRPLLGRPPLTWLLVVVLLAVSLTSCRPATPDEIRVGAIFDLTGATSEVCIPYAVGVRDYVAYINEKGGINGRQVVLTDFDYGYNIERAKEIYAQLVGEHRSMVIMGWGTGDTEAMRALIASDQLPFMSASYAELLTDPQEAPYNFLIGVTYSDQMRIAMQYILDTWTDASRPPRVALIYNDTLFGLSPIQDGRDYAAANGIEIVDEEIVALSAADATVELQNMAATNPDYAIVQETTAAGSLIVSTAHNLGLSTRFIMLNWSVDEKFITLTGEAGEGVLGTAPFAFPYEEGIPGMDAILSFNQARGVDPTTISNRYVQGWTTMQIMLEGVRLAGDDLTGPGIRSALESIVAFNPGGITSPITFTPSSHKGATQLKIYQVQDGKWLPITDYIQVAP